MLFPSYIYMPVLSSFGGVFGSFRCRPPSKAPSHWIEGPWHKAGRPLLCSPNLPSSRSAHMGPKITVISYVHLYVLWGGQETHLLNWNHQNLCNPLNAWRHGLWIQNPHIPALSLTSYTTLSGPQCPHLKEDKVTAAVLSGCCEDKLLSAHGAHPKVIAKLHVCTCVIHVHTCVSTIPANSFMHTPSLSFTEH